MTEIFTIGKLADACGVGVETIRFYERKGMLKQPPKKGTFRSYPLEYVNRVLFIKRSQELGFTLNESKELLELRIRNQAKCSDVLVKTEKKVLEINEKIRDLKKMKRSLERLMRCCDDRTVPLSDCPILECFMEDK